MSKKLTTYTVMITDLGTPGLTYSNQAAARTPNEARMLVVKELAKLGVRVPCGAIVACSEPDSVRRAILGLRSVK